jgi:aryl-alcohol dehydrogenase-like predicted oxidoreductase
MAKHFGMTVTPWAPLGGGALTGKYLKGDKGRIKPESNRLNERAEKITRVVMDIAQELGVSESHVALQWTMSKGFSCIPIVGATKLDQLKDNLKTIDVVLSPEHIQKLDDVSRIELGFPGDFFNEDAVKNNSFGGFYDKVEKR